MKRCREDDLVRAQSKLVVFDGGDRTHSHDRTQPGGDTPRKPWDGAASVSTDVSYSAGTHPRQGTG